MQYSVENENPKLGVGISVKDISLAAKIEIIAVALEVDTDQKGLLCENEGKV